jgi:porin
LWKLESNTQNEGGFYAVVDQVLWKENNDSNRGINAFAQYGRIPNDPSIFNQYKGFGFVYYGALKNRSQDEIGLAWGRGSLSNNYLRQLTGSSNSSESVLETYYNYVLSDQIEIQLDSQYIVNPGVDEGIKNAWVGIVRVKYHLF